VILLAILQCVALIIVKISKAVKITGTAANTSYDSNNYFVSAMNSHVGVLLVIMILDTCVDNGPHHV
jgi:hypothetical protein